MNYLILQEAISQGLLVASAISLRAKPGYRGLTGRPVDQPGLACIAFALLDKDLPPRLTACARPGDDDTPANMIDHGYLKSVSQETLESFAAISAIARNKLEEELIASGGTPIP